MQLWKKTKCSKGFLHYIGLAADVTATLELISSMEYGSPVNSNLMEKYESLLSNACKYYNRYNLTPHQLVHLIIAGERFELKTLLSSAIELASKCANFGSFIRRYHEISDRSKLRIAEQKLRLSKSDFVHLWIQFYDSYSKINVTRFRKLHKFFAWC